MPQTNKWTMVQRRKKASAPYKAQYSLHNGSHVYVIYSTMNDECCNWNKENSGFLLHIPFSIPEDRYKDWHVYVGRRFIFNKAKLHVVWIYTSNFWDCSMPES